METLQKTIHPTKARTIKILQFGEGNFLRAFIDWFIQTVNDTTDFNGNVAVVQPLANGRVKELAAQDGLYTLLLEGIENGTIIHHQQIIDVLSDFINPYEEFDRYLAYAKSEELQIILSNTTEAGIAYDAKDLEDTKVSASYPGKLLSLLKMRYDHFQGDPYRGLYIIPCELIDHNGDTLKEILLKLAKDRGYDKDFQAWLIEANYFYNTLVDRIVPGYPKAQIHELETKNGYIDQNIVKGEIFHLWVLEGDKSITNVFPFDKTNLHIILSDDIRPYKERKVKILNGSHTCMVPIAYQYGVHAVHEIMKDQVLKNFLMAFLQKEVWETIALPQQEIEQFTSDVMERFENPTIYHELLTISLNSMTKYKTRILPSATAIYEKTGKLPTHALFSLASLCTMYRLTKEDGSLLIQDDPAFLSMFQELWEKKDTKVLVETVLSLPHWEYDFHQMKGSEALIHTYIDDILDLGMQAALEKHFG